MLESIKKLLILTYLDIKKESYTSISLVFSPKKQYCIITEKQLYLNYIAQNFVTAKVV